MRDEALPPVAPAAPAAAPAAADELLAPLGGAAWGSAALASFGASLGSLGLS